MGSLSNYEWSRIKPCIKIPAYGEIFIRASHWRLKISSFSPCQMKAIWNDKIIAQSDNTVCHRKGTASYYHVSVDGLDNPDGAWYYPDPSEAAQSIKDHIAFWKGIQVQP
jgi:uncharacterized protein (DUF427 family)